MKKNSIKFRAGNIIYRNGAPRPHQNIMFCLNNKKQATAVLQRYNLGWHISTLLFHLDYTDFTTIYESAELVRVMYE